MDLQIEPQLAATMCSPEQVPVLADELRQKHGWLDICCCQGRDPPNAPSRELSDREAARRREAPQTAYRRDANTAAHGKPPSTAQTSRSPRQTAVQHSFASTGKHVVVTFCSLFARPGPGGYTDVKWHPEPRHAECGSHTQTLA